MSRVLQGRKCGRQSVGVMGRKPKVSRIISYKVKDGQHKRKGNEMYMYYT